MRYIILAFLALFTFTGCADTVDYTIIGAHEEVGFFHGLWHGMISWIAFIVSLFDDTVSVYAIYNSGGWYDLGFLIGFGMIWGSGCKMKCKTSFGGKKDKEWDEIGEKVEAKVMHKLKDWAEDDDGSVNTEEWDEISKKVEAKLKRKIRDWAEKD